MKLSVRVITYNHARFVAQAVEGALGQRASFDYEIVIGDDASTDGTREIILDYSRRYPERIRLVLAERNQGGRQNFVRTFLACRGEYVALLDGDDYWTCPEKLQRQVEFLDRHPDHAICFHDALVVSDEPGVEPRRYIGPGQAQTFTIQDLLRGNFIPACAAVLRRTVTDFPEWFHRAPVGDWPLHILTAQSGKIGYLDEVMAVYRVHPSGQSRHLATEDAFLRTADMLAQVDAHLAFRYAPIVRETVFRRWIATVFSADEVHRSWREAALADVARAVDRWPAQFPLSPVERQQFLGAACAHIGLASFRQGDPARARSWLVQAVRHGPRWLLHPGLWSVALEAVTGRRAASRLRRMSRFARRR